MANSKIIKFAKTFHFEGKEYNEVNLSALDDLTTEQIAECDKKFELAGNFSALKEMNLEYCLLIASLVTNLPIEFFKMLPAREGIKIKQVIGAYFFQED